MSIFLALASYVLITTFTPGPNNISATAAGVKLGFRKSLPYLAGIALGFLVVLLLAGYLNFYLQNSYAQIAGFIKWIGFAYLLWLGVSLFIPHSKRRVDAINFSLWVGVALQLINPKAILYSITLFGMFPSILLTSNSRIFIASVLLAIIAFSSVALWCAAGAFLTERLEKPRNRMAFNILLALLLLYTAIKIVSV